MADVCETLMRKTYMQHTRDMSKWLDMPHEPKLYTQGDIDAIKKRLDAAGVLCNFVMTVVVGSRVELNGHPFCRHCGSLYVED